MLELISAEPFLLVDRNSRFLAELIAVSTPEQAKEAVAAQRIKHADSSSIAYGFAVGQNAEILGCSDDGEPAGTAGRPILEVLKGSKISNVILTVTRWFGGTKLGTGGLVHAFGGAAKGVIETAVTRERIAMTSLEFTLPYSILEIGKRALADGGFTIEKESYNGEGASIKGSIPTDILPPLAKAMQDISRGKIMLAADQEK
ncbi:MAG: YigZ family protein [Lentisphaeria bacterium]|nr:YigZ family protein [Lentisphaeria bacterium]